MDWVATAPTPASAQVTSEPTLNQWDWTATPRSPVCGSCAMVLNGEVGLACRTQVYELEGDRVTVEPLPNLPPVRDLVVDMDAFLTKDRAVMPWLEPRDDPPSTRQGITRSPQKTRKTQMVRFKSKTSQKPAHRRRYATTA